MHNKLQIGIIGCAKIAVKAVMPAIVESETSRLAAVASRDEAKAREAAQQFGIEKSYSSYEAMLEDPEIDAVYIPLPNHLHREWAIRAAEAGKHVLCEKPLALTPEEAEEMVRAADKAGVKLAEAFMYRHHPRWDRIRAIIAAGEIGELRAIRGAFTFNGARMDRGNVRFRSDFGGGSIYDVGCYPISAARLITGLEPEAVSVHAQFLSEFGDVDMMASGLVEFGNGLSLTFDCGMLASYRNFVEIVGADGRIELEHAFKPTDEGTHGFTVMTNGERREERFASCNQYALMVDDFARSIWGEQSLRFTPEDATRNMRVIEACIRSAKERTRVTL